MDDLWIFDTNFVPSRMIYVMIVWIHFASNAAAAAAYIHPKEDDLWMIYGSSILILSHPG
jgi:hypothetical protein